MDLRFHQYTQNGVMFKLASLTKMHQARAPLEEVSFASFTSNAMLCIPKCLNQHKAVTNQFQVIVLEKVRSPVLLILCKPHRAVTTQLLEHWVKKLLEVAGVYTEMFKVHSMSGATMSAPLDKGVHISNILSIAAWSQESTF